ncbi:MAG: hypothetical protein PHG19_10920 [Anaerotignum sp.]|nr:hypothetical protein [Anaerotignum sp.]
MKKIIGTMIGFYFIVFFFAGPIYSFIFPWGGVGETHLHPIYFGLIVLSVLIVICTSMITEEIRDLKQELKLELKQELMKISDHDEEEK